MRVVESTTCVQHAGHKNTAASKVPSRLVVQEADGTTPVEGRGVLNSVYAGRDERRRIAQEVRRKRNSDKQSSSGIMTTPGADKSTNDNPEVTSIHVESVRKENNVAEQENKVAVETTDDVGSKKTKRVKRGKKSDPSTLLKSNISLVDTTTTKKRKSTKGSISVVEVKTAWVDTGKCCASNILSGKRKRKEKKS